MLTSAERGSCLKLITFSNIRIISVVDWGDANKNNGR